MCRHSCSISFWDTKYNTPLCVSSCGLLYGFQRLLRMFYIYFIHSPHQLEVSLRLADSDRLPMPYHSEFVGWFIKSIPPQNLLEVLLTIKFHNNMGLTPHILSKGLNTYLYLSSTFRWNPCVDRVGDTCLEWPHYKVERLRSLLSLHNITVVYLFSPKGIAS